LSTMWLMRRGRTGALADFWSAIDVLPEYRPSLLHRSAMRLAGAR
jgi:hypothetical protein